MVPTNSDLFFNHDDGHSTKKNEQQMKFIDQNNLSTSSTSKDLDMKNDDAPVNEIQFPNALEKQQSGKDGSLESSSYNLVQEESKKIFEEPDPSEDGKQVDMNRYIVDTAAPFESVKEAVNKFGGSVDWKAHKMTPAERLKHVESEIEKAKEEIPEIQKQTEAVENSQLFLLKELEDTKKLIEELKVKLDNAQIEEHQVKQDSEHTWLRVTEMEKAIVDDNTSIAIQAQLDIVKARHTASIEELSFVRREIETLRKEYASLVSEKEIACKKAEEAENESKDIDRTIEELTTELIVLKENLEGSQNEVVKAEENLKYASMENEKYSLNLEDDLMKAEEELQKMREKHRTTEALKENLDSATTLLNNLKVELRTYLDPEVNTEENKIGYSHECLQDMIDSAKKELEQVRLDVDKAKQETRILKVRIESLNSELLREKSELEILRQRKVKTSAAAALFKSEVDTTRMEIENIHQKEKEITEKMNKLPMTLQKAAQEANQAKLEAQLAKEELRKVKEEAEQTQAVFSNMENKLQATLKEIEVSKVSERLALEAIKALQESERAKISNSGTENPSHVTLSLEEYYELGKKAYEAEEEAKTKVKNAITLIEKARESEKNCLEKLDEIVREMEDKKKVLKLATEKAEIAKGRKLAVEQELRKWRSEHEQRRKALDSSNGGSNQIGSPRKSLDERKTENHFANDIGIHASSKESNDQTAAEEPGNDPKNRKKKLFFPRFIMFLTRRKHNNR